jgi:hypothetical protein
MQNVRTVDVDSQLWCRVKAAHCAASWMYTSRPCSWQYACAASLGARGCCSAALDMVSMRLPSPLQFDDSNGWFLVAWNHSHRLSTCQVAYTAAIPQIKRFINGLVLSFSLQRCIPTLAVLAGRFKQNGQLWPPGPSAYGQRSKHYQSIT